MKTQTKNMEEAMSKLRARFRFLFAFVMTLVIVPVGISLQANAATGRIVFTNDRSGSWQIYTMNSDGSDVVQVTNLAPTEDDQLFPSLSPDGKQIAFSYDTGDGPDLYIINIDGTGLRAVTTDHSSLLPRWSPDGKTLVFTGFANARHAVIASVSADGTGNRKVLTTDLWESVGAIYTPNGKQIVFGSQMGGFVAAVWIMNANGSHPRRLTRATVRAQPWGISPDGKHIVGYTNQDTPPALGSNVFVMNLDGSEFKGLATTSVFHHDIYPSYSPDGTKVTFVSDRFSSDITQFTVGTFDIVTTNTDGTDLSDIAPSSGFCLDANCVTPLWGNGPG
jgi:Tol biopolymer transport system component